MRAAFKTLKRKNKAKVFHDLIRPMEKIKTSAPALKSRGDRPLQMSFENQLNSLVYYHLEEHASGRHLVEALKHDPFAKEFIAPEKGIGKSSFFEIMNTRGLDQLLHVYNGLLKEAAGVLPDNFSHLGKLIAIDGSFIDAVSSMEWADYRTEAKKAKVHVGFDINHAIPSKFFLSDGKTDERPYVDKILEEGQTGIMDRYYQHHRNFDYWQRSNKHFVCRIRENTRKTVIDIFQTPESSIVFYDAKVLLGTSSVNQTELPLRLVGYTVDDKSFWVATDRFDLTAEEVASIYKLRWEIESFFGWWKQHLNVYHVLVRSRYGLLVQLLGGLITYLLLAIYCRDKFNEGVSIRRVREMRYQIRKEMLEEHLSASVKVRKSPKRRRKRTAKT
jgi:hypothetical protein